MKSLLSLTLLCLWTAGARAAEFVDHVKIAGFRCDGGKAGIQLRSLETDRILYLAKNLSGSPEYLLMQDSHCVALAQHLKRRLAGQILDARFQTEEFSRLESVYLPPKHPCRPGATKCDEEGTYTQADFRYLRTETTVDGFRFFWEQRQEKD